MDVPKVGSSLALRRFPPWDIFVSSSSVSVALFPTFSEGWMRWMAEVLIHWKSGLLNEQCEIWSDSSHQRRFYRFYRELARFGPLLPLRRDPLLAVPTVQMHEFDVSVLQRLEIRSGTDWRYRSSWGGTIFGRSSQQSSISSISICLSHSQTIQWTGFL